MTTARLIAFTALLAFVAPVLADEMASVPGSNTKFKTAAQTDVSGSTVKMKLTGTALRQKMVFKVYSLASYIQDGTPIRSADELVNASAVKQLHLIMERDVSGGDMAEAFQSAVRLNYPAPAFSTELPKLYKLISQNDLRRGEQIWLTSVPGKGLHVKLSTRSEQWIESPELAKAVWEIYLGKNNLGDAIKAGLVSRK